MGNSLKRKKNQTSHAGDEDSWRGTRVPFFDIATPQKRLLYQRDLAGFNNVRITFESLVCAAALTHRELVIPPPSVIDHLSDQLFHELHVFDAQLLASAVSFVSGDSLRRVPTFLGSLDEYIRASHAGDLDHIINVVLDDDKTRLQHFECLKISEDDARKAANTVLKIRFAPLYEISALQALELHGLKPETYHGIHLRRGDFAAYRPNTQWSGSDLQGRVISAFPSSENTLPLVVACVTNAKEKDPFPELAASLQTRNRVIRTDELWHTKTTSLHAAILDTIFLTKALRFAGTPDSTFSTGVWHWRALNVALSNDFTQIEAPITLAQPRKLRKEQCWQRCTTFEALR